MPKQPELFDYWPFGNVVGDRPTQTFAGSLLWRLVNSTSKGKVVVDRQSGMLDDPLTDMLHDRLSGMLGRPLPEILLDRPSGNFGVMLAGLCPKKSAIGRRRSSAVGRSSFDGRQ